MRAAALAWLVLLCIAAAGPLHAQETAVDERRAVQQLEALRGRIKALTQTQQETAHQRSAAATRLREQEQQIAAATATLRTLDAQLQAQNEELERLSSQRGALLPALQEQRLALARWIRSAHALGQDQGLKVLLMHERVDSIGRALAYHRYFQRARHERIQALLSDMSQLARLEDDIRGAAETLREVRASQEQATAALQAERALREQLLDSLVASLREQDQQLQALAKDEAALLQLLEKLRDIFADIPDELDGGKPFAQRRGQLPWPLSGPVLTTYGGADAAGRKSSGMLIGAAPGSEVRAVAHGRVAFADWLAGYGMLLIIDHGDGYLSLYGYNDALLKDVGDWISPGDVIASSGTSGGQRKPGVYFELRKNATPINPRPWLQ